MCQLALVAHTFYLFGGAHLLFETHGYLYVSCIQVSTVFQLSGLFLTSSFCRRSFVDVVRLEIRWRFGMFAFVDVGRYHVCQALVS